MKFTFPVCTAAHCTGEIRNILRSGSSNGSWIKRNDKQFGKLCRYWMYADYSHCLFSDWLVEWLGRREAVIVQQGAGWVQEWAVTPTRGWHAIKLSGHSQHRPAISTLIFDTVMHTQYLEMSEKIFNSFIYTLRSANALRVYAASSRPMIA